MRGKKILSFSTIAISFTVLMLAFVAVTPPVFAGHCTTTVTAPANIQTAVDGATSGDVVCLSGTFRQSVVFGLEDSGITLSEADSATAILDGSGTADSGTFLTVNWAILLKDGLSNVTIENLEIRNYAGLGGGGQGNAIQAWDVSTSNIIVRNNYMHDNGWNGVLVGSEGDFIHNNWTVEKNSVTDNGFVGIELTNTINSKIVKNNAVDNGLHGILVQARNTIGSGVSPVVSDVVVSGNKVTGTVLSDGIRFLAFEGLTGSPFTSVGGMAKITSDCEVTKNNVKGNAFGIRLQAFNVGATVEKCVVKNNNVIDNTNSGIRLLASASGTTDSNDVLNNRAIDNGGDGIVVEGDTNDIEDNKANNNGGDGINVSGDTNDIEDNKANGNTGDGIDCGGTGNTESGNKAKDNGGTNNTGCP